ncbi:MAG: hypothetical protein JRD89_19400 [Deltaproteobacteria bacterium]|nr:hypothetical protein [Deltaproteobacteria bacterium]
MAQIGKLRKILDANTEYEQEVNRAYVIRKIGTDDTAVQQLFIDGKALTKGINTVNPLRATDSNRWGPLDLGDLFLVIPPKYKFEIKGTTGKITVIDGEVHIYEPGEAVERELMDRFGRQHNLYRTFDTFSYSHGTDEKWLDDQEVTIASITPPSNERYTFDGIVGVKFTEVTLADGTAGIRMLLDGRPLDILGTGVGRKGIDAMAIPWPPTDATQEETITLEKTPVVVEPDHTLEVTAVNTSGADITPGAGASVGIDLVLGYRKERVA